MKLLCVCHVTENECALQAAPGRYLENVSFASSILRDSGRERQAPRQQHGGQASL